MGAPKFTRLLPDPAPVDIRVLIATLSDIQPPPERPYTIANFVASADGMASFQGRSGALSDAGDREIFHALREQVDAVLAGTHTLATESYGRMIKSQDARARRAAAGRPAEPLACVVSSSGNVPLQIPLFAEPEARIIVFSPAPLDLSGTRAAVEYVRTDPLDRTPLASALRVLRSQHDVRTLLCEGGPTLMRSLLAERLLDELFLTLSPALTGGGSGPTISAGPPLSELAPLALRWVLRRGDALYLRYAID